MSQKVRLYTRRMVRAYRDQQAEERGRTPYRPAYRWVEHDREMRHMLKGVSPC